MSTRSTIKRDCHVVVVHEVHDVTGVFLILFACGACVVVHAHVGGGNVDTPPPRVSPLASSPDTVPYCTCVFVRRATQSEHVRERERESWW